MSWSINDQKSRKVYVCWEKVFAFGDLLFQFLLWEQSSTDLLCDSSCFSFLDIGSPNFVEKSRLARVDVTEDNANWTPVFSGSF